MLHTNRIAPLSGPAYFTIMGIDPGSSSLGTAALHVDIASMEVAGIEVQTLHAHKLPGGRAVASWMLDAYSERSMRLRELSWMVQGKFHQYQPLLVACEAPFFNPRNPNAYQVLVETMKTIENALYDWNPWRPLYRIETSVAKKAVMPTEPALAATAKAIKDAKERVLFCASKAPELTPYLTLSETDEHSLDAVIVAYAQLLRLRQNDFRITF